MQQGQKSTSACPEIIVATNPEYANTQQGLPDQWVYLAHISRHARFLASGCFAEKHLGLNPTYNVLATSSIWEDSHLMLAYLLNHVGALQ